MSAKTYVSENVEQTQKFAERFSRKLRPGGILALYGDLGAGKTTFIQGLAKGLGYQGKVFSPTFIFVRPYKLSNQRPANRDQLSKLKTLYHIDLYRIEKPSDVKSIGLEDFLGDPEGISFIEWPERIEDDLPKKTKKLFIDKISETEREFKWIE